MLGKKSLILIFLMAGTLSVLALKLPSFTIWDLFETKPPVEKMLHPLVGKLVPDVALNQLDGSVIKLSEVYPDQIVILDFWASWCGPCRMALPELESISSDLRDQKVVIYAVNQGEDSSVIKAMWKELGLSMPVVSDEGTLAEQFLVSGIPQTVVIGSDGIIHAVHNGFSSRLGAQLRSEISSLLAGENLAQNQLKRLQQMPMPYHARPIPVDTGVSDWNSLSERRAAMYKRILFDELERSGNTNAALTAYVERFCKETYQPGRKVFGGGLGCAMDINVLRELYAEGDRLIKDGVKNPALFFCHLDVLRKSPFSVFLRNKVANKKNTALAGYATCENDPAIHPFFSYVFCNEIRLRVKNKQKWCDEMHQLLPQIIRLEAADSKQLDVVALMVESFFRRNYSLKNRRLAADALLKQQDIPEWFGLFADGFVHVDEAWEARGGGWAKDVTPEGWVGFKTHIERARTSLTRAWELHPELPQVPSRMISVALAKRTEPNEARKWFDRTVAAQVDEWGAYDRYATTLMPRWGGSMKKLAQFAKECVDTGRFDTDIPWVAVEDILPLMYREAGYPDQLPSGDVMVPLIRDLYEGYRSADNLNGDNRVAIFTCLAALAVDGQDYALAHKILSDIQYQIGYRYFDGKLGYALMDFVWMAWYRGGPSAALITQAVALTEHGDFDGAMALYDQIMSQKGIPRAAADQLEVSRALVQFKADYQKGDWVPVYSDKLIPEWTKKSKYWGVSEQGWLRATQRKSREWLPVELSFLDGFELEMDFQSLTPWKKQRLCLFFADPDWHGYNTAYLEIFCGLDLLKWRAGREGEKASYKKVSFKPVEKNHLHMVVKNGMITIEINGDVVIADYPVHSNARYKKTVRFGLGDYSRGSCRDKNFYNNIRVRAIGSALFVRTNVTWPDPTSSHRLFNSSQ